MGEVPELYIVKELCVFQNELLISYCVTVPAPHSFILMYTVAFDRKF